MTDNVLIVGRGPSAYQFDWASVDCPIMAVSSGIFAVPEGVVIDHFISLDQPKFFMVQVMGGYEHAWENDVNNRHWPFWSDASIQKHVPVQHVTHAKHIPFPINNIMESLQDWADLSSDNMSMHEDVKSAIMKMVGDDGTPFGFQPGWADFTNVRGWPMTCRRRALWGMEGPVAVWRADSGLAFCNSLFMAVQVAARLGYKRFNFIGVDLLDDMFADSREVMRRWHMQAMKAGLEWVNLSQDSRLSEFMPTVEYSR